MLSRIRQRKNGIWFIDYTVAGQRTRRTLNTRDKSVARRIQKEFDRTAGLPGLGLGQEPSCPVEDFELEYFPWAEKHKRRATVQMDQMFWRQFMEVARVSDLGAIGIAHVERFKSDQLAAGLKPQSVNVKLGHLASMFSQAVKWRLISQNPFKEVQKFKIDRNPPRWLTKEQTSKLLIVAEKHGPNMHIVFALGIYAGLRKAEIAHARWEWFDFERKVISLTSDEGFGLKGRRSRSLPLHGKLAVVLLKYGQQDIGYVLNGYERNDPRYRYDFKGEFAKVAREAELSWVTPHVLRHTFGSLLAAQGVSLYKIGTWLGHADTRTTQDYAHLSPVDDEIERLRV